MSRLDFVTVGIVAVCLAALGFLVYKTVGLMNGKEETPAVTENYVDPYPIDSLGSDTAKFTDPAFSYTDEVITSDPEVSTYSEEDDRKKDIVSDSKTADKRAADSKTTTKGTTEAAKKPENVKPETAKTETPSKKPGTPKTETKAKETVATKPKVTTPTTKKAEEPTGRYFVQAGAFSARANAETLVKELKRLGYPDAKTEITKSSAKAIVVVDYFANRSDADALVKTLKSKHSIDALVKSSQ